MEWRYLVWGATQEASLKVSSEAQNSFLIKNCIGEDMGQFSAGPINKAARVSQVLYQQYVNGDGRHSKHLSLLKKCSLLRRFLCLE